MTTIGRVPPGSPPNWRLVYELATKTVRCLVEGRGETHPAVGCEAVAFATLELASEAITKAGWTVPETLWTLLPAFAQRTVPMSWNDVDAVLKMMPGNAPASLLADIAAAKATSSMAVPASIVKVVGVLLAGVELSDQELQKRLYAAVAEANANG